MQLNCLLRVKNGLVIYHQNEWAEFYVFGAVALLKWGSYDYLHPYSQKASRTNPYCANVDMEKKSWQQSGALTVDLVF